jgi:diguanylate cyclase (GGDEF)-like protein
MSDAVTGLLEQIAGLAPAERAQLERALRATSPADQIDLDTDELTNLVSGVGLAQLVTLGIERARASGEPLRLVRVDIRALRRLNEDHGEAVGDEALRRVAGALRTAFRSTDVIGRIGDDDFVVLCAGKGTTQLLANRVDAAFNAASVGMPAPLVANIAIVQVHRTTTFAQLVSQAERELRLATVEAAYRRAGVTPHR